VSIVDVPSAASVVVPRGCTFEPSDWAILARAWYPVARCADVGDALVSLTVRSLQAGGSWRAEEPACSRHHRPRRRLACSPRRLRPRPRSGCLACKRFPADGVADQVGVRAEAGSDGGGERTVVRDGGGGRVDAAAPLGCGQVSTRRICASARWLKHSRPRGRSAATASHRSRRVRRAPPVSHGSCPGREGTSPLALGSWHLEGQRARTEMPAPDSGRKSRPRCGALPLAVEFVGGGRSHGSLRLERWPWRPGASKVGRLCRRFRSERPEGSLATRRWKSSPDCTDRVRRL